MALPPSPRRLAFLGTPAVAARVLRALLEAGAPVVLVVTGEDKRRGRRGAPSPTPVGEVAAAAGVAVGHRAEDLLDAQVDLGIVVAYGKLIRPPVLARVPMVNLHFSLLPRWRGAAPVERALLAGDRETGVCVMEVVDELDAGGVYRRSTVPIGARTTASELREHLTDVGIELLLDGLRHGFGVAEAQVGEHSYAAKLNAAELRLDWRLPAALLDRTVRVGGAWTTVDGRRLKVWRARPVDAPPVAEPGVVAAGGGEAPRVATGSGSLELEEVQPEGRPRLDAAAWWRGLRVPGPVHLGT